MFKGLSFDFMQVFFLCNFDNHNLNDVDAIMLAAISLNAVYVHH